MEHNQDEIIIKCSLEEMAKAFFKDYEIIWHDPNVNSQENQQHMAQLEKLCKVKTFTEWKKAEDYIKTAKTVCHVITSGTNGELFVKEIFSSQNVPNIFTFCREKDNHSIWAKNYEKVLCTETKIEDVISQIQKNLREWQKQVSSLRFDLPAFAPIFDDYDKSTMNHLHLYLKVIPNFKNYIQARNDYLNLSKVVYIDEENKQFIAQFERTYDEYNKEAILKWYTRQSFVYKVINNCLRIATSDSIQYCRFLLNNVEKAIKDQYQKKSKNFSGLLYRGAYLSVEEWSSLKANVNKEIEMHGFLSATKDENIALKFVKADPSKKVFITIIVPRAPPNYEEEQGFAEVEEFSEYPNEQEVLFNVRSRFTVLETDDGGSKDSPYRQLVLLYGAQGLRKFVAENNYPHLVEGIKNISDSRCQGSSSEITEKIFFKSLKDPTKPIYSCKGCLDPNLGPFLCVTPKGEMPTTIKGCLLTNSIQTQIPLYGYQCSKCGVRNQKGYFVCTDCSEKKMKWCENCFENSLSCIEIGHSVLLETSPFSFWCEKMLKRESNHLTFQNDIFTQFHHELQQGQMFFDTHEYEKAINYYSLYISQNEGDDKKHTVSYALNNLGSVYQQQGEYKKAIESYLKSLEILKLVYGDNHPDAATPYHNIGLVFQNQGEHQKALESYLKSVEILKSVDGGVHPDIATSYDNIGAIYNTQGNYKKAFEYHQEALEINNSVLQGNHPNLAYSYSNLGLICEKLAMYQKALELYLKSLDIRKLIHGENHPTIATSYDQIGTIYRIQGVYKKAIEYHLKALNIYKSGYGENHPDVATSYRNIGVAFEHQGEYKEALKYHLKSLKINELAFQENHPDIADSYSNIGKVLEQQEEYEKALEYHFKSLEILKLLHVGENHPNLAIVYSKIGSVLNSQGKFNEALEYHLKALKIHKSANKKNHPDVATSYSKIGLIFEDLGDPKEALKCHLKSVAIFISVYGENHPDVATCYRNLGMFYEGQGEYEQALIYHKKTLNIFKSIHGEVHSDVATSYGDIGEALENQEEFDKALENYFESLNLFRSVRGEISSDVAKCYNNIGLVYQKKGESQKAIDYFLKSLEIMKSIHGEIHSDVANPCFNIAWGYQNQGEYEKALPYHLKSLDIRKSLYGEFHADVAISYENIGVCNESLREYKHAYEYYLRSLQICKEIYGEDHSETAILQDRIRKVAPKI